MVVTKDDASPPPYTPVPAPGQPSAVGNGVVQPYQTHQFPVAGLGPGPGPSAPAGPRDGDGLLPAPAVAGRDFTAADKRARRSSSPSYGQSPSGSCSGCSSAVRGRWTMGGTRTTGPIGPAGPSSQRGLGGGCYRSSTERAVVAVLGAGACCGDGGAGCRVRKGAPVHGAMWAVAERGRCPYRTAGLVYIQAPAGGAVRCARPVRWM
ncbi:hypothetical protein CALCODRAFT_242957 [Calocera cornea HHB12733]|uniref:Uncharacterized protein n=1 Tax=Calocera cornea HHB12733 TaxID=1353952 RepID=A0A165GQ56_9BASI|nr:hypothetical protein CALCODRAFT_242957 [Calocera cornea HHB12733]